MKKTNKKGFTIVELVIVIAVIAILAAVLIPTFSGVVARANQSAAQQLAMTAVKSSLLMVSTAQLPDGTFILINSSKTASKEPDYGYEYNGNALGNSVILKENNVFKTSYVTKCDTILVNASCFETETETVASGSVASSATTIAPVLKSMLNFVNLNSLDAASVTYSEDAKGNIKITVTHDSTSKTYNVFTSPDIPANAVVFVPLGSN